MDFELEEAYGLVEAVEGWEAFGSEIVKLNVPNPKGFIGLGKLADVKTRICAYTGGKKKNDKVIVFFNTVYLSAMQNSFLSNFLDCKVFDRYSLILAIFYSRVKNREAHLQVELAELQYVKSRMRSLVEAELRGSSSGSEEAGLAGESRIELEKRKLSKREVKLRRELEHIESTKKLRRGRRQRTGVPVVGVVGYTNVGKTALIERLRSFGGLSNEEVMKSKQEEVVIGGQDKLFATLDSRASAVKLHSGLRVVFMDTIGFISNLPHGLVSAFRSTLDEVLEADVIVHVRDCSHVEEFEQNIDVHNVMDGLFVDDDLTPPVREHSVHRFIENDEVEDAPVHPWKRHIEVINKVDKLEEQEGKDGEDDELEDDDVEENADTIDFDYDDREAPAMQHIFRYENEKVMGKICVEPAASVRTSVKTGYNLGVLMDLIEKQVLECTDRAKVGSCERPYVFRRQLLMNLECNYRLR